MNAIGLYYLLEGFAVAFFGIMATQNLWPRGNRLRTILGWVLAYWCVQHLLSIAFTMDFLSPERHFTRIVNAIDMTAEPTCAFLLMELCRPGWLTWKKIFWNELPFVVLGLISIFSDNEIFYFILIGFFFIYGIAFMTATLIDIKRYNRFLKEHYSYDENVNLRWLYIVLVTFVILMVTYTITSSFDTLTGDIVYLVGSIICWSWVCYCIQRQESVLDELQGRDVAESPVIENDTSNSQIDLEQAIKREVFDKQLYLNPMLKLGDMAKAIGTNRTYLSRYLNDTLHTNFYDYINALRLEHALQLIKNTEDSIMVISSLAGFNSYSTFRRTFIAKYNVSPQEYRNQHG